MPCFYLNPNNVNQTSELQVCIAEGATGSTPSGWSEGCDTRPTCQSCIK